MLDNSTIPLQIPRTQFCISEFVDFVLGPVEIIFTFLVLNRSLIINFRQTVMKRLTRQSSCLFRLSMMLSRSSKSSSLASSSLTDFASRARHQASQQSMGGGKPLAEPETECVATQPIHFLILCCPQRANSSSFARGCQHVCSPRASYLSHPSRLIVVSPCQWQHSRLLVRAWLGRV